MKRFELHRHLDVSVRPGTALEFLQALGHEGQSTSLESFCERWMLKTPHSSLSETLALFERFQLLYCREDWIERIAFEALEDCLAEGLDGIEFRYSPSFIGEKNPHISWKSALAAIERGLARAQAEAAGAGRTVRSGLLCIASRDYGAEGAEKTIDFYLSTQASWLGVDLAGDEEHFPNRLFASAFARARKAGARVTIHAGEGTGAQAVWSAIEDLGAERIGHGISSVEDPELVKTLQKKGICLEICPTSNWITGCVPSLRAHPLPVLLRAGVPVCLNTDDPGIFGVTLAQEVAAAQTQMGLTDLEITQCFEWANHKNFFC